MSVDVLAELLTDARTTVVLSGAGVSTASGIPDYRSPSGLGRPHWDIAQPAALQREPRLFWRYYRARYENLASCRPNPGHQALADLEAAGSCRH